MKPKPITFKEHERRIRLARRRKIKEAITLVRSLGYEVKKIPNAKPQMDPMTGLWY